MRELVNDVQTSELPTVPGLISDEVIAPQMVLVLSSQPDHRPIGQKDPCSLRLTLRNLEPLLTPHAVDKLRVDLKAFVTHE